MVDFGITGSISESRLSNKTVSLSCSNDSGLINNRQMQMEVERRRLKVLAFACKAENVRLAIASGGGSGDLQASIAKSSPAGTPAISWWGRGDQHVTEASTLQQ